MALIFRKTALGVAEVETRAHRLAPRMRSALILVDGKRSERDLGALIQQQCEATLQALLDQGFIEATGGAPGSVAPPIVLTPARAPVAAPQPAPAAPPVRAGPPFEQRRRDAVRRLNDLTGPEGDAAAMRIERASNFDELRAALGLAVQVIGHTRGRAAAEKFAALYSDV